jgi:signal transduction histidine kinase
MSKAKPVRWSERTRMLFLLQVAVVLPALALIFFTVFNLRTIQRDGAVEAAIQRDFSRVLKIADRRLTERANQLMEEARKSFPGPDDSIEEGLDRLLKQHPQFSAAGIFEPHSGLVIRFCPGEMEEKSRNSQTEMFTRQFLAFKNEKSQEEFQMGLREREGKGISPFLFYPDWLRGEDGSAYTSYALTTLPNWGHRFVLALVAFNPGYLRNTLFPATLNGLLAEDQGGKSGAPAAMMLRWGHDEKLVAASKGWDGGEPEVDRPLESGSSAFPKLILGIKLSGTTIEALSQKFMRTNFLIIGAISVLLMLGIWQTYRNVSREMAVAKLKSDFVANVSHELRTPLSLIRLYAETLELGRLTSPDKPQEYYRIIRKESERLTGLINNILDFSRIEAGKKEYDFRDTDLAELVRNTLDAYRFQIEQHGFTLETSVADDLPPMRVDREAIARSLLNLINNAVKYSAKEKFLSVKLYRENGHASLEVRDHGIGIPRNEQARIFEKFYRVGDPLVHNTKGSGLGLSLVRHIVEAHGGAIVVESAPDEGSKFTIELPIAPPQGNESRGQSAN